MNRFSLLALLLVTGIITTSAQDLTRLKDQKPFAIDGTLSTTANFYSISGKESTRDPFSYVLSGNVSVSVYSLQLPFSFTYSNNSFNYAQPFNRFGISPEYKWARLHLGYRSMSFSPLTLAGHSFLGAGVELNPGKFRFGAVYGRFSQKTVPNSVNPNDTLQTPTRRGYSVKIGVGSAKNFADLIFLQIADDTLSFDKIQYGSKTPQANTVLGSHVKFTILKKVTWETEGAVSLLTKNLYSSQPFEIENAMLQNVVNTLNVNSTSEYSTALTSTLNYNEKKFTVGLQYRRIDPNFQSFGAYYFNTDIENITINTKFRLLKNKLSVNGNIGLQNDNLRGNKASRSSRVISMANVSYNSGKVFTINGSFSNYSINQQPGRLPLNDTIKLYQSNRNITITPALNFSNAKYQQMIQLNLVLMDLTDHNQFTATNTEINSRMALLNYFFNHVKTGINVMAGINYTTMTSALSEQTIYGINTDVGKSFFKGKLSNRIGLATNRSILKDASGWVNTATASLNFTPHKKHLFKLNFSLMQNLYPETSTVKSFNETKVMFSYVYKI
jgi:hypothetical protein